MPNPTTTELRVDDLVQATATCMAVDPGPDPYQETDPFRYDDEPNDDEDEVSD